MMALPSLSTLILLAVCGFSAQVPSVRSDHPRLFFTRETWPSVRAQALGSAHVDFDCLRRLCDGYPERPTCSGMDPALGHSDAVPLPPVREWGREAAECAFVWRVTGERAYLDKARRMLVSSVAAYNTAYANRRAVHWNSTTRILAFCAYDWIWEALTPDERRDIIVPFVTHVEDVQPGPDKPHVVRRNCGGPDTGHYGVKSLLWYSGLAAVGDGFCDEMAAAHLAQGWRMGLEMCDFRAQSSGDDGEMVVGVPDYSMGNYPWAQFNFFHTCLSATGIDLAGTYRSLALFPNWIWWNWIPTAEAPLQFGFGDTYHSDNRLPDECLYEHLSQYVHFWRKADPDAARLAATLRRRVSADKRRLDAFWPMYPFVLRGLDDVEPFSEAELAAFPVKARHFERVGQFVMRSGWRKDSTYCLYTAGGTVENHRHYDDGNFVIYQGDFLALDTGSRGLQTDYNLSHYYAQTVAHNCVLIHRKGEPLPEYWGLVWTNAAESVCYGGQVARGKGKVLAFEADDDFTYVASDATANYGEKCTECVRQFVHLQPGCFVVYDRVGATRAGDAKTWLLHTAGEPEIVGQVARSGSRGSVLRCQTLLPQGAGLEKVGGSGREYLAAGRNWELDPAYVREAEALCKATGRGPYFGTWRLEVTPPQPANDDRFLHVMTAGAVSDTPAEARLVREDGRDGAVITYGGRAHRAFFDRCGAVGGEIDGRAFSDRVQGQSGVWCRKPPRFRSFEIGGLEQRPDFWKVRPDEIVDLCSRLKKCAKKEVICRTSLGYPVYALSYGTFAEAAPQTNWSAGQGSTTYRNYTGRPAGLPQTFLLLAGVHGSEPENVAATMNLLQMLETGRDFRGKSDSQLLDLIAKYRLIVIPCLNMDGRAISPDHLRGVDWDTFRRVSQGVWKDGSRIGWRGSKAYFPLPLDRVAFPGGYPNADGYNIMHDATPGDIRTAEARALLKLAARWRVDVVLNCHSYEWAPSVLRPSGLDSPERVKRGMALRHRANAALFGKGLTATAPTPVEQDEPPRAGVNLNNLFSLASGALALTLESSVSYDRPDRQPDLKPTRKYTFEELMEPLFVTLKEMLADGLEAPFVARGKETVYDD